MYKHTDLFHVKLHFFAHFALNHAILPYTLTIEFSNGIKIPIGNHVIPL